MGILRRVGVIAVGSLNSPDTGAQHVVADVESALHRRGYSCVPIRVPSASEGPDALRGHNLDVAFFADIRQGGSATLPYLCELYGLPYTGSSAFACALAADRQKTKELLRVGNLPTPPYMPPSFAGRSSTLTKNDIDSCVGYPALVKPRQRGEKASSLVANNSAELLRSVQSWADIGQDVLIERWVEGRSISVGLLQGNVLGAVEKSRGTHQWVSSQLTPLRQLGIFHLAARASESLGCSGAVIVNVILTERSNEYIVDVDVQPDLAAAGVFAGIAAQAGLTYDGLCDTLVSHANLGVPHGTTASASTLLQHARPAA